MAIKMDKYNIGNFLLVLFIIYGIIKMFNMFIVYQLTEQDYDIITNIDTVGIALTAGVLLLLVALKFSLETTSGKIWGLIGIGQIIFAIAEGVYGYIEVIELQLVSEPQVPSLADFFYIIAYPVFYAGLLWEFKIIDIKISPRDMLIFIGTILVLTVITSLLLFIPILEDTTITDLEKFIYIYYPLADLFLVIIVGLIFLKFTGGKIARPWLFLLIAFLIMGFADLYYNYDDWNGLYGAFHLADLLYYISYALMAFSALAMHKMLSAQSST